MPLGFPNLATYITMYTMFRVVFQVEKAKVCAVVSQNIAVITV